ncbi:DUF6850 family outer membrane beta-barrel protein [Sphingobacterium spiritivorum]|uniref:DUF6850 family outer membrane beta-barrel protein n=1 Tax=Sphingobacterium spiritivorum TaxID=258 RepID=UPI003DA3693B
MRYLLVFVLHFIVLVNLHAQMKYDSDSIDWQRGSRQKMSYLLDHPALIQDSLQSGYGKANLDFLSDKRNYRGAQQAYSTTSASFSAEGYNQLGRVLVAGKFYFNKTWEDSLSYRLGGIVDQPLPTYYFVPKAGKFERQTYQADAYVSYEAVPNRWKPGINLSYLHHWATRSVDPRMDYYEMTLKIQPEISFIHNKTIWTVGGIIGYGRSQTDMSYKSSKYSTGNLYPEYLYYLNLGYGSFVKMDTATLRKYDSYKGLSLKTKTEIGSWSLFANADYIARTNKSTNDRQRMVGYYTKQRFDLDEYKINIFLNSQKTNNTSVSFGLTHVNGADFNAIYGGKNYLLTQWTGNTSLTQVFHARRRWEKEIGIDVSYFYDERQDAATQHYTQRSYVNAGLLFGGTYKTNKQDRVKWSIQPSYRLKLNNVLTIPETQLKIFSTDIAYPEYYYYDVNVFHIRSRLEYFTKRIMKNYGASFYVEGDITSPEDFKGIQQSNTKVYTGKNSIIKAGINLYL